MGTMEHTTMNKEEGTMTASKKNGTTPGKNTINEWISSINIRRTFIWFENTYFSYDCIYLTKILTDIIKNQFMVITNYDIDFAMFAKLPSRCLKHTSNKRNWIKEKISEKLFPYRNQCLFYCVCGWSSVQEFRSFHV